MNMPATENMLLAAMVAPEDLECGSFVAILNEVLEFPSFLWCDSALTDRSEPVRVRLCTDDGGAPLKIQAICLPFVFTKTPQGEFKTIDVRRVQLVRLKESYAKAVWGSLRKTRRKAKSRKSRK